jgi:ABC-type glycerol-3-phosphate transport system substrate-binding protein
LAASLAKFRDMNQEVSLYDCGIFHEADVVLLGTSDVCHQARRGALLPLNDMMDKSGVSASLFDAGALAMGTTDDGIVAIPFLFSPETLFCNRRILPESAEGWDVRTLDDLLRFVREKSPKLHDRNVRTISYSHGFMSQVLPYLPLFGGSVTEGGNAAVFHKGPNRKAIDYVRSLIRIIPEPISNFSPTKDFFRGRTAMIRTASSFFSRVAQIEGPYTEIHPMVRGASPLEPISGIWMAMTTRCRNQELAWRFIRSMSSLKSHRVLVENGTLFPSRKDAIELLFQKYPKIGERFSGILPACRYWTPGVAYASLLYLDQLISGWLSIEEDALDDFLSGVSRRWKLHIEPLEFRQDDEGTIGI